MNIQWSPLDYQEKAVVAKEASQELLSRMDWMTLKPEVIVDLGCGTGAMSVELQNRYPDAYLIAFDWSQSMIEYAKRSLTKCVRADATKLPLSNHSVNLIFANFLFPWQNDLRLLLRECKRVLCEEGLLMFTALGPDTLKELPTKKTMPYLIDMHDLGDLLLAEGFADPVLDVNHYIVTYRDQKKFAAELQASGMLSEPLVPEDISSAKDGTLSLSFEVIYAHAFTPEMQAPTQDIVAKIPLSQLRNSIK